MSIAEVKKLVFDATRDDELAHRVGMEFYRAQLESAAMNRT
jgi:hypothetical protein